MGGAQNHRMGLWDAAMIKDNHVAVAGSVGEAVRRAAAAGIGRIIVEVDRFDQIEPALAAGATHLLLDNMDVAALREAVALVAGRVPTEASGGVTLETIRAKAETGVTYVSVGRITQSAPAADIGLDFAAALKLPPRHHLALDHPRLGMMLVEPALDDPEVARVRAEDEIERVRRRTGSRRRRKSKPTLPAIRDQVELRHAEIARLPDRARRPSPR